MGTQSFGRWPTSTRFSMVSLCLAGLGWLTWSADAQEEKKKGPIQLNKRQKLDAAAKLLEGLAVQDKDLIHEGSVVLTELTKADVWRSLKDAEYREHTQAFRTAIKRLDEAAQESRFDAAQLEWLAANKSCFDCHSHIRAMKTKSAN